MKQLLVMIFQFWIKTKNDNKNDIQQEKIIYNVTSDYLKHEPIKNEKGNYKYIKIIDIRKNENYGGLYIFMRKPSPLSLKVRSKFAELYLLPKKVVFIIAKNYSNIWSKIHRKDFHNMLSIKHQTFNILNKYIEINGIVKISPNDVSRYVYAWEELEKKNKIIKNIGNNKNNNNYINKDNKKIKKKSSLKCPSPINNINKDNKNQNNNKFDLFSNKSLNNALSSNSKEKLPLPTETDFSHLLNIMVMGKQQNNINTQTNQNVSNSINNGNNDSKGKKDSSHSVVSNLFYNKQKTKSSNEGKTLIIPKNSDKLLPTLNNIFNEKKAELIKEEMKKTREKEKRKKLFSFGKKTARIIRNKNYALFLLDKSTNQCIEIKNNIIFNISNNSLNQANEKPFDGLNNYISFCQDNVFLDKISEIKSSSEDNSIHNFNEKDLSQQSSISFSLESIYQNINLLTKMKYSEDKNIQKKTLNYINKLIENKESSPSIKSFTYSSSEFNQSNDFSKELLDENILSFTSSKNKKSYSSSMSNNNVNSQKYDKLFIDNSNMKSEKSNKSPKKAKVNKIKTKTNNTNKFYLFNSSNSKNSDINEFGNKSMSPKKLGFKNKNKKSNVLNKEDKFIFRIERVMKRKSNRDKKVSSKLKSANNEKNSCFINNKLELGNYPNNKKSGVLHKNTNYLNINQIGKKQAILPDNSLNNIKIENFSKSDNKLNLNLTQKESDISDNKSKKSSIKGKYTKKYTKKLTKKKTKQLKVNQQVEKFKSEQRLIKIEKKRNIGDVNDSIGYFAQEKREEDCLLI